MSDTPDLSLNCWVLDDALGHRFVVDIAGTQKVSHLKKAIKDEKSPHFDNIPADQLDIYRTAERAANWDDDDDEEGLLEALANGRHSKLQPGRALSKYFSWPVADGGIHILVKPPSTCELFVALHLLY
ncbi:hypothetical protein EDD15DRAFT_2174253 [Pisolithus albus]|nr:hypothetical protein EDD15DRAFT_2174253 [Pisolithus albus]